MRTTLLWPLLGLSVVASACGGKVVRDDPEPAPPHGESASATSSGAVEEVMPYPIPDPNEPGFPGFDTTPTSSGSAPPCPSTVPAPASRCSDYRGAQCEFTVPKGASGTCHWHCRCVASESGERWRCAGAPDCYP